MLLTCQAQADPQEFTFFNTLKRLPDSTCRGQASKLQRLLPGQPASITI
mgnify:CR=1 FL=1